MEREKIERPKTQRARAKYSNKFYPVLTILILSMLFVLFIIPSVFSLQINEASVRHTVGVKNVTLEWSTDTISNSSAEVWISGNVEKKVISDSNLVASHKLVVNNLTPSTQYFYTVKSASSSQSAQSPQIRSFTTLPDAPPQNSFQISELEHDHARILWNAPNGYSLSYRVKLNGNIIGDNNAFDTQIELFNLVPQTNYTIQITTINQNGQQGGTLTQTFTTPEEPLEISFIDVRPSTTTATLNFQTNFPSTIGIEYYPIDNPALTRTLSKTVAEQNHMFTLSSLLIDTSYKIKITAKSGVREAIKEQDFVTLDDQTVPVSITDVNSEVVNATSVKISWRTSEVVPSEVVYSIDDSFSNIVSSTTATAAYEHEVILDNLLSDSTYNYKIRAGSPAQFTSNTYTFTTLVSQGQFLTLDEMPELLSGVSLLVSGGSLPQSRIFIYVNDEQNPQASFTTAQVRFNQTILLRSSANFGGIPGNNKIKVEAYDAQGNKDTEEFYVVVDNSLPLLDLDPIPEFTRLTEINISGIGEIGSTVEILINNVSRYNQPLVERDFTTRINLDNGDNSLIVTLTDSAGNINVHAQSIVVDSLVPEIEFLTDLTGESHFSVVRVRGITEPGSTIYAVNFGEYTGCDDPGFIEAFNRCDRLINEETMLPSTGIQSHLDIGGLIAMGLGRVIENKADSQGEFTIAVSLFGNPRGGVSENHVKFYAVDRAGNVNEISRTIRFSPECPDWQVDNRLLQVFPPNLYTSELRHSSVEGSIFIPLSYSGLGSVEVTGMQYYLDENSIRGESFGLGDTNLPSLVGQDFEIEDGTSYVQLNGEPTFFYDDGEKQAYFYAPLSVSRLQDADIDQIPNQLDIFLDLEINYNAEGGISEGQNTCHLYPQVSFSIQKPEDISKFFPDEMIDNVINGLDTTIDVAKQVSEYAQYASYVGLGACGIMMVKSYLESSFIDDSQVIAGQCTDSQEGLEATFAVCDRVICPAVPPKCEEFSINVDGRSMEQEDYQQIVNDNARIRQIYDDQQSEESNTRQPFNQWLETTYQNERGPNDPESYTDIQESRFIVQGQEDSNEDGIQDIYEIEYFEILNGQLVNSEGISRDERSEIAQAARECNPNERTLVRIRRESQDSFRIDNTRVIGGYEYRCGVQPPEELPLPSDGTLPGCYSAECPQYDNTKCFGTDDIYPPNGLFASARCGCITGFKENLDNYIMIMESAKQCLESAQEGRIQAGVCDRLLAQFVCDILNELLLKSLFGGSSSESILGSVFFERGDLGDHRERANALSQTISNRYDDSFGSSLGLSSDQLVNTFCIAAISLDWSNIQSLMDQVLDTVDSPPSSWIAGSSRAMGYNPFSGKMSIGYDLSVFLTPTTDLSNVQLRLECDRTYPGSELCSINTPPRIIPQFGPTIQEGSSAVDERIIFTDQDSLWWYNKLVLEFTYTLGGQVVNERLEEPISRKGGLAFGCSFSLENGITCNIIDVLAGRGGIVELYEEDQGSRVSPNAAVFYSGNDVSGLIHIRNNYQGGTFYVQVAYDNGRDPIQYAMQGANEFGIGVETYLLWLDYVDTSGPAGLFDSIRRTIPVNNNNVNVDSTSQTAILIFDIETDPQNGPERLECALNEIPEYGFRSGNDPNDIVSLSINDPNLLSNFNRDFCTDPSKLHDRMRAFCGTTDNTAFRNFVEGNLQRVTSATDARCISQYDFIGLRGDNTPMFGDSITEITQTLLRGASNDDSVRVDIQAQSTETLNFQRTDFNSDSRTNTRTVTIDVLEDTNGDGLGDTPIPYSDNDITASQEFTLSYEVTGAGNGDARPVLDFIEPITGLDQSQETQVRARFFNRASDTDIINNEGVVPFGFVIVDDQNQVDRLHIQINALNRDFSCEAYFYFDEQNFEDAEGSLCEMEFDRSRSEYFNTQEFSPPFVALLWKTAEQEGIDTTDIDAIYEVTVTAEDPQHPSSRGSDRVSRRFKFDAVQDENKITPDMLRVCLGGGFCNEFAIHSGINRERQAIELQARASRTAAAPDPYGNNVYSSNQQGQQGQQQGSNQAISTEPFSFVIISDMNGDAGSWRDPYDSDVIAAANAIVAMNPAFIASTGDHIAGQSPSRSGASSPQDYRPMLDQMWQNFDRDFYSTITTAGLDLYINPGNHDAGRAGTSSQVMDDAYQAFWSTRRPNNQQDLTGNYPFYYAFTRNNNRFINLDGSTNIDNDQIQFLRDEIGRVSENIDNVFIFSHVPFNQLRSCNGNCHIDEDISRSDNEKQEILRILDTQIQEADNVYWFSGHQHTYFRGEYNGLPITISGALDKMRGFGYIDNGAPQPPSIIRVDVQGRNVRINAYIGGDYETPFSDGGLSQDEYINEIIEHENDNGNPVTTYTPRDVGTRYVPGTSGGLPTTTLRRTTINFGSSSVTTPFTGSQTNLADFARLGGIYVPDNVDPNNAQVMFLFHGNTVGPRYIVGGTHNFNQLMDQHTNGLKQGVILVELVAYPDSSGRRAYSNILSSPDSNQKFDTMFNFVQTQLRNMGVNTNNAQYSMFTHSQSSGLLGEQNGLLNQMIRVTGGLNVVAIGESTWPGNQNTHAIYDNLNANSNNIQSVVYMLRDDLYNRPDSDNSLEDRNTCRLIEGNSLQGAICITNPTNNHEQIARDLFTRVLADKFSSYTIPIGSSGRTVVTPTNWLVECPSLTQFTDDQSRLSQSVGVPQGGGSLEGGVQLTENSGYIITRSNTNNEDGYWGTVELVTLLERTGCMLQRNFGTRLKVWDMTHLNGGYYPDHQSHQSGRDADVEFICTDDNGQTYVPCGNSRARVDVSDNGQVDPEFAYDANWEIIKLWYNDATVIFLDEDIIDALHDYGVQNNLGSRSQLDATILDDLSRQRGAGKIWNGDLSDTEEHDDHFHLRIQCPQSDTRCIPGNIFDSSGRDNT